MEYRILPHGGEKISVIGEFAPQDATGICVYCNHCQPCPMGLNVGLINKYYDLALPVIRWQKVTMKNYRSMPTPA